MLDPNIQKEEKIRESNDNKKIKKEKQRKEIRMNINERKKNGEKNRK